MPHNTVHVSVDQRMLRCLLTDTRLSWITTHRGAAGAAPPSFARTRGLSRRCLTFIDMTGNDFSAASPELSPDFHLTCRGGGGLWSLREVGVISESATCRRPCFIVTSWANSHHWFLINNLLYSFISAYPNSPLCL